MYLFFHGLALTHPINGAILMLVTPLFVGIFDHIRVKSYPKPWFMVGTIIAAAGSIWLMIGKGAVFNKETLTGDLYVAVNALFYAIYLVRVKRIAHIYKPITINKITFTFGTLYMLPIGGLALLHTDFQAFHTQRHRQSRLRLILHEFLGLFTQFLCRKKAGPTLAGLYIYLQPVMASIIAVLLGADTLTVTKVATMTLIMGGVFLATRFSPK